MIKSHRQSTIDASFTTEQSGSHDEDTTNSQGTSLQEGECTSSQSRLITQSPSSSRELSIPSTLPWYPRHLQGRISLPGRRKCEYTIRYPDHAVLDPKVNGSAEDATSLNVHPTSVHVPENGEWASSQKSAGSNGTGRPHRKTSNPSESHNGKYAISRPGHAKLYLNRSVPGSSGQGKTTMGDVAPVVILGLTVGFFVGMILMKKRW